jgi:transcriptional regulator with XRE-family HTH domain
MDTMTRDPEHLAGMLRSLRQLFQMTQEALAASAEVSTRTIEKLESGRHGANEQTLRSIARALNLDVKVFDKPSPEEEQRQKAEIERALRKTAFVTTHPVRSAQDFMAQYGEFLGWHLDTSIIEDDQAEEIAAEMGDWLQDLEMIWCECPPSQRLQYAREFASVCRRLEARGYVCHMGHYRAYDRGMNYSGRFGLLAIRPMEAADGERYAMIPLGGTWEVPKEDRADGGAYDGTTASPSNGH